ncbi:MAG: GNAT family N-acetyltransferase [Gammaproteobacteria bacterium]|nr:GNAT family N-acetyltransferase [Gammaproteobacteria bacterium]
MADVRYQQTVDPAAADIEFVRQRLRSFNRQHTREHPSQSMAVLVRDGEDNIIGGAIGEVAWGWLYTDLLWVDEQWRGQQIGRELLRRIERMADDYDVVGYHLSTTSFQALDFYRRCGYEVWGQLDNYPPGFTNYALARRAQRA